jgi:hypothetical protein
MTSDVLRDEVASLAEAAPVVEAEIVRIASACQTVLPSFGRPVGLLRPREPLG